MVEVNWSYYRGLLNEKISDCWYNWEQAKKAERTARASYEAVLKEAEAFEKVVQASEEEGGK